MPMSRQKRALTEGERGESPLGVRDLAHREKPWDIQERSVMIGKSNIWHYPFKKSLVSTLEDDKLYSKL